MINHLKSAFILFAITLTVLYFPNCRGDVIATDEDYSTYGWSMYENKEYRDALVWFGDAINKDSSHFDAYNGMGWTMGHLRQVDSSVYYFQKYLSQDSSFVDVLDFYAGLSFAYNAIGNDTLARRYAETYFFGNQNSDLGDPDWCFCHNTDINQLDVRLILAISEFRMALFDNCQSSVNQIYKDMGLSTVLNEDLTTVQGRTVLVGHISSLQKSIKSGENGLNCSEDDGSGGGYCS